MKLDHILNKKDLSKEEIICLLELSDFRNTRRLFDKADEVRKAFCGDEVHLRGIIEFSNYCGQDCLYCGLRHSNTEIERYRMTADEIIETAKLISNIGIRTIVLQSGEDPAFDVDKIAYIIYFIKQNCDVAITLSLGERDFEEYKTWRYAGADRYLIKHETANPRLYSIYHQKQKVQERIEHLQFLKSIGFQIGSGNLIGLPGQTVEDIADDLLLCRELDVDMASFSPFVPSPNTPYRNKPVGSVELTLKTIAVGRILMKNTHIPATTAIATIDSLGREKALRVGANVIMPNFTPTPYRDKYCIYPNKKYIGDNPLNSASSIQHIINSMGRKVSTSRGDSMKQTPNLSQII
ncbi:MAG TPA: [FeFe] hydrogenase H-cluster radical SAM maturase HydE [Ignavibacteriales bacterium]|nr:[FeFe] hydrogenase H-cluster radical SAM maturase HydE [Ignavibacteriales bacterium]